MKAEIQSNPIPKFLDEWHAEAVKHHAAAWSADEKGNAKWEWKE